MDSEQALKLVEEKMAREAESAQPEQTDKPEIEQPALETTETEQPKDEPKEEPKEEEKPQETEAKPEEVKEPEEKPEDVPEEDKSKSDRTPPRKKYSHEERVAHAFSLEKQKRKEQHAKDQARIKELEAELDKYKNLKMEDFGERGQEDWFNWKLKEQDMRHEVQDTKARMEREEAEELQRETERRVALSFDTEEERDDYNELIRTNGPKFYEALQQADPEGVVLSYLSSVEKYPVVLQKLMTDMDSLRYVFRDKDPIVLRFNLHQFTKELLEGDKKKPEEKKPESELKPEQTKPQEVKPAMPIIGKQVTAAAKPSEPVHDRSYWNDYLKKHPRG